MSHWISVEERLPPANKIVLACRVGKTSYAPFMVIRKARQERPWQYLDGDTCTLAITHWCAIPSMPEPPK